MSAIWTFAFHNSTEKSVLDGPPRLTISQTDQSNSFAVGLVGRDSVEP
jgi:hypothetical protein